MGSRVLRPVGGDLRRSCHLGHFIEFEELTEVTMCEFYDPKHLSERLAAVCKERDELKKTCAELRGIVEKQARLNRTVTFMALELDQVKAERDALLARFGGLLGGDA